MFPLFQYYRSVIKNNVQDTDFLDVTLFILKYFDIVTIIDNILLRVFRDVHSLIKTLNYLDGYFAFKLFDIVKCGSSSKFFTEEVSGLYIEGHSAGTTFLNDSLMSCGIIGLFLFPLILVGLIGFVEYLNPSIFYKSLIMLHAFVFIQNGFLNFFIKVWPFILTLIVILALHEFNRVIYKKSNIYHHIPAFKL